MSRSMLGPDRRTGCAGPVAIARLPRYIPRSDLLQGTMAFKLIDVATPEDRVQAVLSVAEDLGVDDVQKAPAPLDDGRWMIRLVVGEIDRQGLLDRLQAALGKSENWRIVMLPADTVIPREEPEEEEKKEEETAGERGGRGERRRRSRSAPRARSSTIWSRAACAPTRNFILLVFLSTVVASVGLEQDSVAILIGAMVIAPLLGPNVAFAFGAAIGDRTLMLVGQQVGGPRRGAQRRSSPGRWPS